MSDHDHTDESDKPIDESVELNLSDLADESDAEFQRLIDESAPEAETEAETDESDTLSEPDLGALVSESEPDSESLHFLLHDQENSDTAPSSDVPADVPEAVEETDADAEQPSIDEEPPTDEAVDAASEEEPQSLFDHDPSPEEADTPAEEGTPDFSDFLSEYEDNTPISASDTEADEAPDSRDEDKEEDEYGAGTSWLDEGKDEDAPVSDDEEEEYTAPEKSRSKLPLLLALLVAVGAAGYFYLGSSKPEQKPTPFMAPQHTATAPAPAQPAEQAAQPSTEPAATAPASPQEGAAQPQEATSVVKQQSKLAVITPQTPTHNGSEASQPKPQPTPQSTEQKQAASKSAPAAPTVAAKGGYALQGGVFVFHRGLKKVEAKVAKLGFDSHVSDEKKLLPMIRLRVGEFPAGTPSVKLLQAEKLVPHGVFTITKGKQVTIYAGSYYFESAAKRAAKRLAAKGLSVQEERVKVMIPVHVLYFGDFSDRAAAEAKLAEVKKAGIDAVVKQMDSKAKH